MSLKPTVRRVETRLDNPWQVFIPPRGPQDYEDDNTLGARLGPYGDSYWPTFEAACEFVRLVTQTPPPHDYPALAVELLAAAGAVAHVQAKLDKDTPGTRACEAWVVLEDALDSIDSALRYLEAEEEDEFYPADPPGTADVIAAAVGTAWKEATL